MQKLFSRCLGKISEFWHYNDCCTDTSGRLLPTRHGKTEGSTPQLCLNSLNYVWYVLVCYTNTSWPSVCHKYFPIQTSARIRSISVILQSHFSATGLASSTKFQKLKAHVSLCLCTICQSCSWSRKSTKDHGSPQLLHTCQNNDTKLRFLLL